MAPPGATGRALAGTLLRSPGKELTLSASERTLEAVAARAAAAPEAGVPEEIDAAAQAAASRSLTEQGARTGLTATIKENGEPQRRGTSPLGDPHGARKEAFTSTTSTELASSLETPDPLMASALTSSTTQEQTAERVSIQQTTRLKTATMQHKWRPISEDVTGSSQTQLATGADDLCRRLSVEVQNHWRRQAHVLLTSKAQTKRQRTQKESPGSPQLPPEPVRTGAGLRTESDADFSRRGICHPDGGGWCGLPRNYLDGRHVPAGDNRQSGRLVASASRSNSFANFVGPQQVLVTCSDPYGLSCTRSIRATSTVAIGCGQEEVSLYELQSPHDWGTYMQTSRSLRKRQKAARSLQSDSEDRSTRDFSDPRRTFEDDRLSPATSSLSGEDSEEQSEADSQDHSRPSDAATVTIGHETTLTSSQLGGLGVRRYGRDQKTCTRYRAPSCQSGDSCEAGISPYVVTS